MNIFPIPKPFTASVGIILSGLVAWICLVAGSKGLPKNVSAFCFQRCRLVRGLRPQGRDQAQLASYSQASNPPSDILAVACTTYSPSLMLSPSLSLHLSDYSLSSSLKRLAQLFSLLAPSCDGESDWIRDSERVPTAHISACL